MRIGIDFRLLSAGGLTIHRGTGRYTQQQVREVLRLGAGHELVLFCREDADFGALLPEIAASPGVSLAALPPLGGRRWDELNRPEGVLRATDELQRALDAQELDVFHLTIPCLLEDLVAFRLDGPVVATHYDLIPLLYPQNYLTEPTVRELYGRALGLVRRADRVVAISHHVRREASTWLGLPAERVRVAWPVADPVFRPLPEAERERLLAPLRARLRLPEGFALTVSHLHHAKNLQGLFSAWRLLPAAARREMPLVLACQLGREDEARVETWARQQGIEADLRLTGLVTDEELVALYNAATLYVHPSRYEGFGLPVLEAMRCGAAVIAGNATSLPEVVGEAGVLFDPEDPAALARAIEELWSDAGRRRELGERAQERAAGFRAEDLGRETLAAYEEAAHEGRVCRSGKSLRLAVWTPVPPQESGIADYSLELLREVTRWADVEVFADDGVLPDAEIAGLAPIRLFTAAARRHRRAPFDAALVQLGASLFHLYMKDALNVPEGAAGPPVVLTLHDLTWGALLHREAALLGEEEEFRRALACSEGEAAVAEHAALMAGDPGGLPKRLEDFLNRHLLLGEPVRATAAQIVHMPKAAADLEERYAGSRVFEFPMGVEDPRLSLAYTGWNDFRPRFGIPEGAFVTGTFGVAHPVKRLDSVLLALERLAMDLPECDPVLLIVGSFADPSYRTRLEDLATELGIAGRVRWLGRTSRRDFELALLACDAVVNLRYPFRHQMSATLMRSIAAGLPVVITDVPEWRHFPDSFCLRVAPDRTEPEALAGHLHALARDPGRRRAMGEAARRFWEEHATPARMAAGYRRVLSEVLGRQIEEPGR